MCVCVHSAYILLFLFVVVIAALPMIVTNQERLSRDSAQLIRVSLTAFRRIRKNDREVHGILPSEYNRANRKDISASEWPDSMCPTEAQINRHEEYIRTKMPVCYEHKTDNVHKVGLVTDYHFTDLDAYKESMRCLEMTLAIYRSQVPRMLRHFWGLAEDREEREYVSRLIQDTQHWEENPLLVPSMDTERSIHEFLVKRVKASFSYYTAFDVDEETGLRYIRDCRPDEVRHHFILCASSFYYLLVCFGGSQQIR